MELDTVRQRLAQLINDQETDLKAVSLKIGKNHAYLQQFLSKGVPRTLPEDVREALGAHFGVSPDEFKSRPGQKLAATPVPRGEPITIGGEEYETLPVFDLRLSAGPGAWEDGDGQPLYFEPYRRQWLKSLTAATQGYLMIARVDGDSMEPTLYGGDQVLIDLTKNRASRDGIYGLRRSDDLHVKRISVDPQSGMLTILSDNARYPPYPNVDPDSISVIGRVIWLGRKI